jgi:hypothetical protein
MFVGHVVRVAEAGAVSLQELRTFGPRLPGKGIEPGVGLRALMGANQRPPTPKSQTFP